MDAIATETSNRPQPFRDRVDAGRRLAERLALYRGQDVLVLGIPRGGVPVAAEVARRLDADLDLVVARKLGAPGWSELALGAVTANGGRFLNEEVIRDWRSAPYLAQVIADQMAEARHREARWRDGLPARPVQGRMVIIDDGLATGATMRAVPRCVGTASLAGRRRPGRVAPGGRGARAEADAIICPAAGTFLGGGRLLRRVRGDRGCRGHPARAGRGDPAPADGGHAGKRVSWRRCRG
jgi:putative phosphoribosyl transferase